MKKIDQKSKNIYALRMALVLLVFVSFSFTNSTHAQRIEISGTIIDNTGMPIPGATIIVKSDPTVGVQSDFDGNYSIEVDSQAILVYSFIGFTTQEITVGNQTTINVTLEESA